MRSSMDCVFGGASGAAAAAVFFFAEERDGIMPVAIVTKILAFRAEPPLDLVGVG